MSHLAHSDCRECVHHGDIIEGTSVECRRPGVEPYGVMWDWALELGCTTFEPDPNEGLCLSCAHVRNVEPGIAVGCSRGGRETSLRIGWDDAQNKAYVCPDWEKVVPAPEPIDPPEVMYAGKGGLRAERVTVEEVAKDLIPKAASAPIPNFDVDAFVARVLPEFLHRLTDEIIEHTRKHPLNEVTQDALPVRDPSSPPAVHFPGGVFRVPGTIEVDPGARIVGVEMPGEPAIEKAALDDGAQPAPCCAKSGTCDGSCGPAPTVERYEYTGAVPKVDVQQLAGHFHVPASTPPVEGHTTLLPMEASARKAIPICTGVLDYFPAALIEIAKVSKAGNDQHNPGQPLHWARQKSGDESDAMVRHLFERGERNPDGTLTSAQMAWRVLANLQKECETKWGYPLARGAWLDDAKLKETK